MEIMYNPNPILEGKQTTNLKNDFSSRTEPSIFTSIAPVLLGRSDETSQVFPVLKSTSPFLPQSTVSQRSDWNSEANYVIAID